MAMSLACSQMHMSPAEAIAAATINAAYSLRRHMRAGFRSKWQYATWQSIDVEDYREIPYYFGLTAV